MVGPPTSGGMKALAESAASLGLGALATYAGFPAAAGGAGMAGGMAAGLAYDSFMGAPDANQLAI